MKAEKERAKIDGTINLRAYSRVEALDNYRTEKELELYRRQRLEAMEPVVEYISSNCLKLKKKLSVLEYCSGSSCFLYQMERSGLLEEGFGVEISPSRFEFAEKWRRDSGFSRVRNFNRDVRDFKIGSDSLDLVVLIDSAFNYLAPIDKNLPRLILASSADFLRVGGYILFEMMTRIKDLGKCRNDGYSKYWLELPENNPFRFALYHQQLIDPEELLFFTRNIYIRRDGFIDDSKKEITKIYRQDELETLLKTAGFEVIDVKETFGNDSFQEEESERLILLAQLKEKP